MTVLGRWTMGQDLLPGLVGEPVPAVAVKVDDVVEACEDSSLNVPALRTEHLKLSTPIRNYGDVFRDRIFRREALCDFSLTRRTRRSRRVKVHLNGLAEC